MWFRLLLLDTVANIELESILAPMSLGDRKPANMIAPSFRGRDKVAQVLATGDAAMRRVARRRVDNVHPGDAPASQKAGKRQLFC